MSAIEDAAALVPWIERNTDVLAWEPLEEAVLRALSGPIPEQYAGLDVPLLRFANTRHPREAAARRDHRPADPSRRSNPARL